MLNSKHLLFAEKPYVTVLDIEMMEPRSICWSCLKVGKGLICSKCKMASYCSKECQKEEWLTTKQHKHECEVFQNANPAERKVLFQEDTASVTVRFIGRLLARKFEDGGVQPEQDRFKFRAGAVVKSLMDVPLKSHSEFPSFNGFTEWMAIDLFGLIYTKRSEFYSKFSANDVMHAYNVLQQRMEVRRIIDGITDVAKLGRKMVGVSLFMQMSRFRYSCDPDVVRIEENGISYFKLLKPEKQNMDLDQLTIGNQTNELDPKIQFCLLRSFLEKDYYEFVLDQECAYCKDEDGLKIRSYSIKEKCPDCGGSLVYDPEHPTAKCFKCQFSKVSSSATKSVVKSALELQNRYTKEREKGVMYPTRFGVLKECLEIFDPVRCIRLQEELIDLLHDVEKFDVLNAKYCGCIYSFDQNCFVNCPFAAPRGRVGELHVTFAALVQVAAALDPDRSLVKKWGDRYRPGLNLEYLLPVMEVVRQGMAFHGLCLYDAIPVKLLMCKVYARAGLKMEAMEIAESVRETMVLCYHEEHPKVKEWDTRLQELSRAQ